MEAVDTVIRVWYSLRILESDFLLLMLALDDLWAADDLSTLTSDFMNVATPEQLHELKKVWETWIQLSTREGCWVTERRNAAFQRDTGSGQGIQDYLNTIPQRHRDSAKFWMDTGLFTSHFEASHLTRENFTLAGSSFQWQRGDIYDYDFSIDPSNLPFTGWDYKTMENFCKSDSLLEMYFTYLSDVFSKCIAKLQSGEMKMHVTLCDCMTIEPFLPVGVKYDRITTSNLIDFISLSTLLAKFKRFLNTNNEHSVLVTETHNWLGHHLPEVRNRIPWKYFALAPNAAKDTNNPALKTSINLTSFLEYYNHIPDFQLYVRAALIESRSEEELASLAKSKKLPTIKTLTSDLGLELRDYVRNENTVFPFKRAVNCRRVKLIRGDEFTLEWKVPSSTQ